MSRSDFEELSILADARFQAEKAKMQHILEEEAEIRRAIARLEDRHQRARESEAAPFSPQRAFGGDVLWQGWVSRMMRDLQTRLAQVLVRKNAMQRELARAFGKTVASDGLLCEVRAKRAAKQAKSRDEALQTLFVLQNDRQDKGR